MKYEPRSYQSYATQQILDNPSVCLMLDMGMGKTVSTLTAVQELINRGEVKKVLIIAPLRVASTTWLDEVDKWEHLKLKAVPVLGSLDKRLKALDTKADLYLINRENVTWLVEYYRYKFPFDMVVIDESSSFKNARSKRFRSLKKVRGAVNRVVELTGTPAPNSLMDLWSQIYLLDGGVRLGRTLTEYRMLYFLPGASNGKVVYNWILKQGADKVIHRKISDICVSMKSEDYLNLPPVINNYVRVTMPDYAIDAYKDFERKQVLELTGGTLAAQTAAVLAGKLMQFANGTVYDDEGNAQIIHSAKLAALEEIADTTGKSLLVFYNYRHDLARLKETFPQAVELKGESEIKRWNSGEISMLLAHPASAGHGLNLQFGGSIIIWYSLTWSLELYQQANKRLHRIGQERTVIIHHLTARGTIDETVVKVLARKDAGQRDLLNALDARVKAIRG